MDIENPKRAQGLILAAALALACVPMRTPTPLIIVTQSSAGLRHCKIDLGMWAQELIDECGKPALLLRDATTAGGLCAIYRTGSHTFRGEQGAPLAAVCLAKGSAKGIPTGSSLRPKPLKQPLAVEGVAASEEYNVMTVIGLAAWPLPEQTIAP